MNVRDSEIIAQSLTELNYVETTTMESADLIIINTCSIREKAEQKVMSLLGYLRKNKKKNPDLKICVAGCVAQQAGQSIIDRMPHVDLVAGTQNIYDIVKLLQETSSSGGASVATSLSSSYVIPRFMPLQKKEAAAGGKGCKSQSFSKFVTIMQGCDNYCSYCVVPFTRGREISRYVNDILDEVKVNVNYGAKEIILLGQNVNSYGITNKVSVDGSPYSFSQLLRKVSAIAGLERLRFTTSNPKDLEDDLMLCFKELPNLCPQIHLPVQSGSNRILKLMNRKYSVEKYLEIVATLREYCPDISITTDVIVGFPGETDNDFLDTLNLLKNVQFNGSFSFKYSDRPGTISSSFADKVPEDVKSKRLRLFQNEQNKICLLQNNKYIGKTVKVMVESSIGSSYKCRAIANHIVHIETNKCLTPGESLEVEVIHAGQHSLKGALL